MVRPRPKPTFEKNVARLKEMQAVYVPARKCWVVEALPDEVRSVATIHGRIDWDGDDASLVGLIDRAADFKGGLR